MPHQRLVQIPPAPAVSDLLQYGPAVCVASSAKPRRGPQSRSFLRLRPFPPPPLLPIPCKITNLKRFFFHLQHSPFTIPLSFCFLSGPVQSYAILFFLLFSDGAKSLPSAPSSYKGPHSFISLTLLTHLSPNCKQNKNLRASICPTTPRKTFHSPGPQSWPQMRIFCDYN